MTSYIFHKSVDDFKFLVIPFLESREIDEMDFEPIKTLGSKRFALTEHQNASCNVTN